MRTLEKLTELDLGRAKSTCFPEVQIAGLRMHDDRPKSLSRASFELLWQRQSLLLR
jgi:hypothetical protein